MKKYIPSFYSELCHKAQDYTDIELPNPQTLIKQYNVSPHFSLFQTALYVVDYVQLKYLIISPPGHYLGYSVDYLVDAGPLHMVSLWHNEDFKVLNDCIVPANVGFIKQHLNDKLKNFIFTYNYRIKARNGKYLTMMQRSMYVASAPDGTPLCAIGFVTNITPYKTDNKIIHTIEEFNPQTDCLSEPIVKNYFFPRVEHRILSRRETDVLKWICDGLSSKQIADKLYVSIHTINNHRKNMLEKTNCKNSSELLSYSIRAGLL